MLEIKANYAVAPKTANTANTINKAKKATTDNKLSDTLAEN